MIYATGISFKKDDVQNLESIVQIKLESDEDESWKISEKKINGWYKKEDIHRWLTSSMEKGFKIKVKLMPYSELIPVKNNEVKYVRAAADNTDRNNLLKLKTYYEK